MEEISNQIFPDKATVPVPTTAVVFVLLLFILSSSSCCCCRSNRDNIYENETKGKG